MRGLQVIKPNTAIPFMRWHKLFLGVSAFVTVASILLVLVKGLSFGIDFHGGLMLDVRSKGTLDLATMRQTLDGLGLGEVSLQEFGSQDNVLIRLQLPEEIENAQEVVVNRIKDALGPDVEYRRIEVVGPQVSTELFRDAIYALVSALLAIMTYLWFRFAWQFGFAGVLALIHDVVAIVGVFALLGYEFNLTIFAALMTIAGYSINDSVVVFDRVRENMRKFKTMPFTDLINLSINQTLSRTFMTSFTVFLVLIALYVLGGEVLRGFSFAMLVGVVVGTYSSVFVAVPLLLYLNVRPGSVVTEAVSSTTT